MYWSVLYTHKELSKGSAYDLMLNKWQKAQWKLVLAERKPDYGLDNERI